MFVDTADGECVDAHYGLGGGTSATRELDIRVYIFFRIRGNWTQFVLEPNFETYSNSKYPIFN